MSIKEFITCFFIGALLFTDFSPSLFSQNNEPALDEKPIRFLGRNPPKPKQEVHSTDFGQFNPTSRYHRHVIENPLVEPRDRFVYPDFHTIVD